jgi:hypothetical protein
LLESKFAGLTNGAAGHMVIIQRYIAEFVMPQDDKGDAAHLAYASFYRMDYLLTWNCNHLANANKEAHIRAVNGRLGLVTPRIITPLELFWETLP